MIWRLRFCNKDGVEARVDIQRGASTPIIDVEGTDNPFTLSYNNDKGNKSGMFLTSSADIEIFETEDFNIDDLKTSNETELAVTYYINNVVKWQGFIIPDFFSIEVRNNPVIVMTASDRLGTLKNVTLSGLPSMISLRELAISCLEKTGLTLPLKTMADFSNGTGVNDFFNSKILTQRLSDTRGRSINCYDILSSILTASNSKLLQRDGEWFIINKLQHEAGSGKLFSSATSFINWSDVIFNFSDINVGGRRTIVPVASTVGVFHEFGGGRSYPDNFNFKDFGLIPEFNFPDWTKVGSFNVSLGTKEIIGYSFDGQAQFGTNTIDNYFFNSNIFNTSNYLQMDGVPVPYTTGQIEVSLDLNATAQTVSQFLTNVTAIKISMGAVKDGSPTLWLNNNGIFAENDVVVHDLNFERGSVLEAQTKGFNLKGVINNPEGYSIILRIYGSRYEGEDNIRQTAVHFAKIEFKNTQDAPKGIVYKREQGTNFTKKHEIDTTIFGDYMLKGLNGYFYEYPLDDTSSLYSAESTLTEPLWTAYNDTEQLPLLQHVSRQKSRLFSVAHDLLSAEIEVDDFDPLAIFVACDKRYTVVSGSFDFFRSNVKVELEEVAFQTTTVREFIYSYFGEGEDNIKSIGGVSGGGGGTGGGLTPEQLEILSWWKKDPDRENTIFTEMNAYSKLELSAYGAGDGGGGGGGIIETVYGYNDLGQTFDNDILTDTFNAYTINRINTRLIAVEAGSALTINTTGTGNAITSLTKSGSVITANKGLTFATQSDINTAINDIQIGGRNLILNTSNIWGTKTVASFGAQLDYIPIQDDWRSKTVTHSFEVKNIPAGESVQIRIDFYRPDTTYITLHYGNIISLAGKSYVTYTVPTDTQYNRIRARINPVSYTSNYNVLFRSEKLEFGTKPTDWTPAPEDHISDTSNPHSVTKAQVGLGNVDNTSDANKPISTATQNALNGKLNLSGGTLTGTLTTLAMYYADTSLATSNKVGLYLWGNEWQVNWRDPSTGAFLYNLLTINGETKNAVFTGNVTALTISASTSVTTPKVIFNSAGWSMEQVGSELQLKHNNVLKMRFTSAGSVVAVEEITAFG